MSKSNQIKTGLDINLFRKEKGGNPQVVKDSQKARFKDPAIVDEIIALDAQWRKEQFEVEQLKKQKNALSKEMGKLF
eukprot:CAMPEP_0168528952 /NCGR_PEP_ID=MMETSP0405-20121227/13589_1 /TAXON_ID=498012 /ORGANISM="Trichosphaerium sp, Strain Am-I-7 wt" /LENGTH=76 /DNA_ID=CAMNT_0008552523 /DNA_START=144 /DNA_END=371 /DNA_ORIENTATION=-